jgi:hypothetical protein
MLKAAGAAGLGALKTGGKSVTGIIGSTLLVDEGFKRVTGGTRPLAVAGDVLRDEKTIAQGKKELYDALFANRKK